MSYENSEFSVGKIQTTTEPLRAAEHSSRSSRHSFLRQNVLMHHVMTSPPGYEMLTEGLLYEQGTGSASGLLI